MIKPRVLSKISDVKVNLFLKQNQEKNKNDIKDDADDARSGGKTKSMKRNIISKPSDGDIPIKRAMLDVNRMDSHKNKAKSDKNDRNDSDDEAKVPHNKNKSGPDDDNNASKEPKVVGDEVEVENDLKKMRKDQLVLECRTRGLRTSGTKEKLIQNLMDNIKKKNLSFRDMEKPDLMKECRRRGFPVSGTRAHLISVLVRREGNGGKGRKNEGVNLQLPVGKGAAGVKSKLEENVKGMGGIRRSRRLAGREVEVGQGKEDISAKKKPETEDHLGKRRYGRVKEAKGVEEKPLQKAMGDLKKTKKPAEAVRNWRMKQKRT